MSCRRAGLSRHLLSTAAFRLTVTIAALLVLGVLVLASFTAPRTSMLLLDMREWRPVSYPSGTEADFNSLQPPARAARALQAVIRLPRIPNRNDHAGIERSFAAPEGSVYCFRALIFNHYVNETPYGLEAFEFVASVNGEERERYPLAQQPTGRLLQLNDLVPEEGRIDLRLSVVATASRARPSWQRATETLISFAWFGRCD